MSEREDQFREKLRTEGKMPAFKKRGTELREEGATKKDSWQLAASEFGYAADSEQPDCDDGSSNTESLMKAAKRASEAFDSAATNSPHTSSATLAHEIQFALDNLPRIGHPSAPETWFIEPSEAPTPACWSMLMMAARNQSQFLRLAFNELTAAHKHVRQVELLEKDEALWRSYSENKL